MPTITINGFSFDPVDERPTMAAFSLDSSDTSGTNYVLIQTEGPLGKAERDALADLGVKLLAYEPDDAYVAWFPGDDLVPIRQLSFVRAAIPYPAFVKVAKDLLETDEEPDQAAVFSGAIAEINDPGIIQEVDIVLHPGVDVAGVRDLVADIAGLESAEVQVARGKLRASVSNERLHDLSLLDEIRHIEAVHKPSLFNDVALGIMEVDRVHVDNPSLRGQGQVVVVCDTGFDTGSSNNVHPAFSGRVTMIRPLGGVNPEDLNGHGTHVAGSVLGDGVSSSHGAVAGTAPGAELIVQAAGSRPGNELAGLPPDLYSLLETPYDEDDARVHNNSWGVRAAQGQYTNNAREVDEFVWDHRDMVVCFAAGNEGRDGNRNGVVDNGSVMPPGTAKNCITVGASESNRPGQSKIWGTGSWSNKYPAAPISNDLWADDPMGMAAFSGRGPTHDGRTKPDLVAPGTSILSAHSRSARTRTFPQLASQLTFWGTSPDPDFRYMGGTSMACPLVAGCAALIREYLIVEQSISNPSAALVKAALINGCVELMGQYVPSEAGTSPNHSSGYGRVNVRRSISTIDDGDLIFRDETEELDTGDRVDLSLEVAHSSQTLKVTLVWTDEPGAALVNDLDLIVVAPDGTERHGNMPPSSSSFDRKNNVEQVAWRNAPAGTYQVSVQAHRAAMNSQSFALVMRVDDQA